MSASDRGVLLRFRQWRAGRPFWAGLLTLLAGLDILVIPLVPLPLLIQAGIAGAAGLLIGLVMTAAGLYLWFRPEQHSFIGVVVVIGAVTAFVTTNMGGFLLGTLLGIVGGSLAFAWTPPAGQSRPTRALGLFLLPLAVATPPPTPSLVAAEPVTLHARAAEISGLRLYGTVTVRTWRGPVRVLKMSLERAAIQDLRLMAGDRRRMEISVPAATSQGQTVIYATKVSGRLFGTAPIVLTADAPLPKLTLEKQMSMTDMTAENVYADSAAVSGHVAVRQRR